MDSPGPSGREPAVLALLTAVLALASPLRVLWMRDASPWWLPFAIWSGVILLGVAAGQRDRT